jgi:hypothetical protein
MRRSLFLILVVASFLAMPGLVQAQSDGTNRLSLEALTAPQPGDGRGGGYARSHSYHPASHARVYGHRGYNRRGYTHRHSYSYHKPSRHRPSHRYGYHPSNSRYR